MVRSSHGEPIENSTGKAYARVGSSRIVTQGYSSMGIMGHISDSDASKNKCKLLRITGTNLRLDLRNVFSYQ